MNYEAKLSLFAMADQHKNAGLAPYKIGEDTFSDSKSYDFK